MDYTVVAEETIDKLVIQVNRLIAHGWRPQGGMVVYEEYLCQAMVREKP